MGLWLHLGAKWTTVALLLFIMLLLRMETISSGAEANRKTSVPLSSSVHKDRNLLLISPPQRLVRYLGPVSWPSELLGARLIAATDKMPLLCKVTLLAWPTFSKMPGRREECP